MPWVYQRPPGHVVAGVLSVKCPVCGNVAPAAKMAARMRRAGQDQTIALWQKPAGRGRMSKATRLSLRQLQDFARRGDVRAIAAVVALSLALSGLGWLDVVRAPPESLQQWAAETVPRPVTGAISVQASIVEPNQRLVAPFGDARSVGQVAVRAKVVG
jgi:hypothetical protein